MNKLTKLQRELTKAKRELEILTWGLSKTNEAIKVLYKDLAQKNKDIQQAKEKLALLATQDSLTGLLNRRSFDEKIVKHINSIRHSNKRTALLFLDLDNLKKINDKYGHQVGDSLLRKISKRLKRVVKQKDICARYGGDEFAVLLVDILGTQETKQITERIIQTIRKPFNIDGNNIKTSASIGIALSTPEVSNYKLLYSMADAAMYKAKQNGKDRYQLYQDFES